MLAGATWTPSSRWSRTRSAVSRKDKVRPAAEHIHRDNTDIPEDLITGLTELGTFGLSVPAEYGGFAEGGESEYLAMVVADRGALGPRSARPAR